ncbi:1-hydroxycarotenoid 3,4-desaturase CrtD [Sulfitobacter sp.]|uniref:1-hydroxycarotenoid 3,4-desaturase CrtD n=1 Tax=Sulfitobacter sp. TaxID=1903071 RepID=UPI004058079F
MPQPAPHVAVIGAGIGGLATALRLANRGLRVTILERHSAPGGKMRQMPTAAGPVDAGPTVLTMKPVFDALFADVGLHLDDMLTFYPQAVLARHFWRDGTVLDLMQDPEASRANVEAAFGTRSANEFTAFYNRARQLYEAFEPAMMQTGEPSQGQLMRIVARNPGLIPAMDPMRRLSQSLKKQFSEPRLAQLFARYATYVGGLPSLSPALLGLIWHAEAQGVWHVKGGMHQLAQTIANAAVQYGAVIHYDSHVSRIEIQGESIGAVHTNDIRIPVDAAVFNGDPRALKTGALGPGCEDAVTPAGVSPRSLSAHVMSFAATASGVPLSAHNVFFASDPESEYTPLANGQMQTDPTLYVCAQDRFAERDPNRPERFEIILNSPALSNMSQDPAISEKVKQQCQTLILQKLMDHGLSFSPTPQLDTMTGPQDFDQLFPASNGSLYGRSPHGMMAAFKRPKARTGVAGLYLTGGGAHPGAGVPMAVLSARHAAEAILSDLPST